MPALHRAVADENETRRICREKPVAAAFDDNADRFVEIEIFDEPMLSAFQPIGDVVVIKIDEIFLRLPRVVRIIKNGSRIVVYKSRIEL